MSHYGEYDYLLVNDVFDYALDELGCLITAERLRCSHCETRHKTLLAELSGTG